MKARSTTANRRSTSFCDRFNFYVRQSKCLRSFISLGHSCRGCVHFTKAHGKAIYCFPIISTNGKRIDGSNNAFRHCYVGWIVDLLCCDISPSAFLSEIRHIQANEKEAGVVAVWGPMLTNNIDTLSIEEQQATIRRR